MNRIKNMNIFQEHHLTIALTQECLNVARKFANQQDTFEKGKQVLLNTLAVCAVRNFLAEISFDTDLNASDSWNPSVRCFHDVADIVLPGLGKLECRPVSNTKTAIYLPPEVRENRIGYIFVQFQEELANVELLGFYRSLDPFYPPQEIQIAELETIENLSDYLFSLEIAHDYLANNEELAIKLKHKFNPESLTEIIAQFERIIYTFKKDKWEDEGTKVIARLVNTKLNDENRDLKDLAKHLVDKLGEIWGEAFLDQQMSASEWSVIKFIKEKNSHIAQQIGWLLGRFEPNLAVARNMTEQELKQIYLFRKLEIAGQQYELRIFSPDAYEEKLWRFQLRNSSVDALIPGGFKLKLFTEDRQPFEGNEDIATSAVEELYIDVSLESGMGLIWEIEPIPEGYIPEILRF